MLCSRTCWSIYHEKHQSWVLRYMYLSISAIKTPPSNSYTRARARDGHEASSLATRLASPHFTCLACLVSYIMYKDNPSAWDANVCMLAASVSPTPLHPSLAWLAAYVTYKYIAGGAKHAFCTLCVTTAASPTAASHQQLPRCHDWSILYKCDVQNPIWTRNLSDWYVTTSQTRLASLCGKVRRAAGRHHT